MAKFEKNEIDIEAIDAVINETNKPILEDWQRKQNEQCKKTLILMKDYMLWLNYKDVKNFIKNPDDAKQQKIIKDKYKDTQNELIKGHMNQLFESNKPLKKRKYKKTKQPVKKYFFITINPKECEIYDIMEIIRRLKQYKRWLKIINYTFEQRGETMETMGNGKHIHMIIENNENMEPSRMQKGFYTCLKNYCEDKKAIHIKGFEENQLNYYTNYILGEKKEDKMNKVNTDNIWRANNNLKCVYP